VVSLEAWNAYQQTQSAQEQALKNTKTIISETKFSFFEWQKNKDRARFIREMRALSARTDVNRIVVSTPQSGTIFKYRNSQMKHDLSIEIDMLRQLRGVKNKVSFHHENAFAKGASFRWSDNSSVQIIVVLSVPSAKTLFLNSLSKIWFGLIVFLLISGATIAGIVRFVTAGLNEVKSKAKQVAVGHKSARIDVRGHSEMAALGHNLNHMFQALEEQVDTINELAFVDRITQLPNRAFFQRQLQAILAISARNRSIGALLFIDLDGFKQVNDSLGHDAGDNLLKQVAQRFSASVRTSDLVSRAASVVPDVVDNPSVSRIGGDEFTLLLPELAQPSDAAIVAQRLIGQLEERFSIDGNLVSVGASIGIACFPLDGDNEVSILKNADLAMYAAKKAGKNTHVFFSAEMNRNAKERFILANELRAALEGGELELYYQPQFDLLNKKILECEALLRWHHPVKGLLPASKFWEVLDDVSLCADITKWVFSQACQFISDFSDTDEKIPVSVNLGTMQMQTVDFAKNVSELLSRHSIDVSLIRLELPEATIMSDNNNVQNALRQIEKLGLRLSVDDFAKGGASLLKICNLPIDQIKLHGQIIEKLDHSAEAHRVLHASFVMADALGVSAVVKGIETKRQEEAIIALGGRRAQGRFYAPELKACELRELLKRTPEQLTLEWEERATALEAAS